MNAERKSIHGILPNTDLSYYDTPFFLKEKKIADLIIRRIHTQNVYV